MIIKSFQKITIIKRNRPEAKDLNEQLQWLGSSLGLFNLRDKDKSTFRLFLELLKAAKRKIPISSDDLATKLKLTRGTVVHHLHKLIDAGIVINKNGKYIMRVENLQILITELQKDINKTTEELKGIAKEIDEVLGL
jgi:predicted transcriptional regulator|tara:strand:- start:61 stop:471 length:411 start_codon:yes stop_codon:yes gene_type:complete